MKKLSTIMTAAPVAVVGLGALTAMPVSAASTTITTTDFEEAIATLDTPTAKGITCHSDGGDQWCVLSDEYVLGGDVDLGTLTYELELSGNAKLDLGGYTYTGIIRTDFSGNTSASITNGTISGSIQSSVASLTLSGLTLDGTIDIYRTNLTITDGTYVSDTWWSTLNIGNGSTVNISGGDFKNTVDAPALSAHNDENDTTTTINISGGDFFSAGFAAIDLNNEPGFAEGPVITNISGGNFKGGFAGMQVVVPSLNTISLTGGTFTTLDTENGGAIVSYEDGVDGIKNMLADGYSYTVNSDVLAQTGLGAMYYIPVTTTIAKAGDDTTIGSPDTGALDTTGAKTATVSVLGTVAAGFAAAASILGIKKLASRKADK